MLQWYQSCHHFQIRWKVKCRGKLSSEFTVCFVPSFLRFASCNSCNIWSIVSPRIRDSGLVSVNLHLNILINRKLLVVSSVTWQHREGVQGISRKKKPGSHLSRVYCTWCRRVWVISRVGSTHLFPEGGLDCSHFVRRQSSVTWACEINQS